MVTTVYTVSCVKMEGKVYCQWFVMCAGYREAEC